MRDAPAAMRAWQRHGGALYPRLNRHVLCCPVLPQNWPDVMFRLQAVAGGLAAR